MTGCIKLHSSMLNKSQTLRYRVNENKFNPTIKINEKIPAYISILYSHKNSHNTHKLKLFAFPCNCTNPTYLYIYITDKNRHRNYVMFVYMFLYSGWEKFFIYSATILFLNWQERRRKDRLAERCRLCCTTNFERCWCEFLISSRFH